MLGNIGNLFVKCMHLYHLVGGMDLKYRQRASQFGHDWVRKTGGGEVSRECRLQAGNITSKGLSKSTRKIT